MQMQFDRSDFAETQVHPNHAFFLGWTFLRLQFPARAIWVGERSVPIAPLETGIAWFLALFHTPKEAFECFL